jgi:hypothetical protein
MRGTRLEVIYTKTAGNAIGRPEARSVQLDGRGSSGGQKILNRKVR